jgi:RimJ/RimL family protein N-acetyltransferase
MEIRTDRLLLRRWTDADSEPYVTLCGDPEVMRHIADGSTLEPAAAVAQIERFERHWEQYGYGLWAVELLDGGGFVGFAGLSQPLFLPEVMPAVELGWRFAVTHWGKGYATEAGRAALDFGFDQVGLDRVIGIADDSNTASWRVMEKLGMTLERTTVYPGAGVPLRVYETHAPV